MAAPGGLADETLGVKVRFSADNVRFIYDTIAALGEANRASPPAP